MKKTIMTIIFAALGVAASAVERVYVSTDKDVYVAGDIVWCSAFCIDSSTGCLSDASSVAYVELSSSRMTSATCKIALIGGRGSGFLQIPFTAPTGNYSILGFTYSGKERPDIEMDAKVISVFNTLSSDRVKGNVRILDASEYASLKPEGKKTSGMVAILPGRAADCNSESSLYLENKSGEAVTLSFSVCLEDDLISPSGASIIDFSGISISDYPSNKPESDGEVLRGRLVGSDATMVADDINQLAFVAFPGYAQDVYAGKISKDGKVLIPTGNIYGDRDLLTEILGQDNSKDCHLFIDSPFLNQRRPDIPELLLSKAIARDLIARNKAMYSVRSADVDTLYEYLPKRHSLLLDDGLCIDYHLDDYTRFPTIRETLVEITPNLRLRKNRLGMVEMQVDLLDTKREVSHFSGNMLVLIDGIPVKDVQSLLDFDPMLLSDIFVYPYTYNIGGAPFTGVADFVTQKGDISSFNFDSNVEIVDWQGVAYPVAYTCEKFALDGEDLRNTLYWHPLIELQPGESKKLTVRTPGYPGIFKVTAEGISASGVPVRSETSFEVRQHTDAL